MAQSCFHVRMNISRQTYPSSRKDNPKSVTYSDAGGNFPVPLMTLNQFFWTRRQYGDAIKPSLPHFGRQRHFGWKRACKMFVVPATIAFPCRKQSLQHNLRTLEKFLTARLAAFNVKL
jgi:hypothetical protein